MNLRRPVCVDLFAGAGGMSLGFEQAGFDVAAAVDFDPVHACTHHWNFPQCATITRSVIGLSGEEIRQFSGIGSATIDVVAGGAPCQGFSLIGRRALDDPRNALVVEFVRLVAELEANYFVFENVKGLTLGRQRRVLEEIVDAFHELGYNVRLPWKVLNASQFAVPQNRQRLILIGSKSGLDLPAYPDPETSPAGAELDAKLPAGPTCADALGDLPEAEEFAELIKDDCVYTDSWGEPSKFARELRTGYESGRHFSYARNWDPNLLTSSLRTAHTDITRFRFRHTRPGSVEPISRFFKLPPDGISNTLRAGTDARRGAFTSPRPIHFSAARCITVREMARLHGFPDWFRFHRTKWHGARQIGNAVPPPLALAVAEMIAAELPDRPARPKGTVSLGPDTLLRMTMSEASAFWGVPVPIGNRNMNSGLRKRRQIDIPYAPAN